MTISLTVTKMSVTVLRQDASLALHVLGPFLNGNLDKHPLLRQIN